jgi:chromosome partitioning protein
MLTVAVLQQKGGSGKTTLAINLAAAAHLDGGRALVVDMDRQASAFDWSAARQDGSPLDGLAVVKADKAMALPRFKEIARGYDYVFLDGPPRLGDVTQSAAVAADVAVLPIQPGPFDFWAVAETLESLDQADQIREQLGRPPIRRVFVLNRASTNTRLAREAEAELRKAGGELAGVVHQRIAFPDAASRGESVLTSSSTQAAADDIQRLWRKVKGGKHGSESQETKPRAKRETREGGRGEARRGREAHRRRRA